MKQKKKPHIALYWCSSCGGCEQSVLDLAEDMFDIFDLVDIVFWPIAMDARTHDVETMNDRQLVATFVNGSIRTEKDEYMATLLRKKSQSKSALRAFSRAVRTA